MTVELTVIVPAYKEEENLKFLMPQLRDALADMKIGYEVLVIDSEYPLDNTISIVNDFGFKGVGRRNGNFYGDAITTGLAESKGEFVIFMDADGSHSPLFIRELWSSRNDADVVVASRYVAGGKTDNPLSLILMSRLLNLTYSVILGIDCKDVSNSFKLYRLIDLKNIELKCKNFDIVEEILVKISKNKKLINKRLIIKEVPFKFEKRVYGTSKRSLIAFIFSYFHTMIKLRFSK